MLGFNPSLSPRRVFLLIFALCTCMMAGTSIMPQLLKTTPCPLCITQRFFVVVTGLLGFIAWLHCPALFARKGYAALGGLSALLGSATAIRHVWWQYLPTVKMPTYDPDLNDMLEAPPFWQTLSPLLKGDSSCAEVAWRFLGLSSPGWTLLCFTAIIAAYMWQFIRRT